MERYVLATRSLDQEQEFLITSIQDGENRKFPRYVVMEIDEDLEYLIEILIALLGDFPPMSVFVISEFPGQGTYIDKITAREKIKLHTSVCIPHSIYQPKLSFDAVEEPQAV